MRGYDDPETLRTRAQFIADTQKAIKDFINPPGGSFLSKKLLIPNGVRELLKELEVYSKLRYDDDRQALAKEASLEKIVQLVRKRGESRMNEQTQEAEPAKADITNKRRSDKTQHLYNTLADLSRKNNLGMDEDAPCVNMAMGNQHAPLVGSTWKR